MEFPSEIYGKVIACPHCGLSVALKVAGIEKTIPPAIPKPIKGKKKRVDWFGVGSVLQLLGLACCLTIVGAIVGIPLLVWGGVMVRKMKCSECGGQVDSGIKFCPFCKAQF
jgi:endogenous inhibitor of DNA gyrase (YacG/DUF329 family)